MTRTTPAAPGTPPRGAPLQEPGRNPESPASAAPRCTLRFLVAGTTITEEIVHRPHGGSRKGLGGVAATMAIALAQDRQDTTLVTEAGTDPQGEETRKLIAREPMASIVLDRPNPSGSALIDTHQGEQTRARGRWPQPSRIAQHAAQLAPEFDITLIDCTLSPRGIREVAEAAKPNICINGTTTRAARRILQARHIPKALITLNRQEAQALTNDTSARETKELPRKLNARNVLVTHAARGFCLYGTDGLILESPAVAVPENTDFIGCGDYAAAGAILALQAGLDPGETIREFIRRKLQMNIVLTRHRNGED